MQACGTPAARLSFLPSLLTTVLTFISFLLLPKMLISLLIASRTRGPSLAHRLPTAAPDPRAPHQPDCAQRPRWGKDMQLSPLPPEGQEPPRTPQPTAAISQAPPQPGCSCSGAIQRIPPTADALPGPRKQVCAPSLSGTKSLQDDSVGHNDTLLTSRGRGSQAQTPPASSVTTGPVL